MKKLFAILLVIITLFALVACGSTDNNNIDETGKRHINIGGLKGPTSMGMVKLMSDNESGNVENSYDFTIAASADELTPKLLKGELDILAAPANLGCVLYNKSNGKVKMAAVNMLGAIYIVEKNGDSIQSIEDLKGKTIYATGKGSTPEYVLAFLLKEHGLDIEKDVNIEWKSEPTETVAALTNIDTGIAMIPQPYVVVAKTQIPELREALDLFDEWEKLGVDSTFITAGIFVNADFAKNNPEALKVFLKEYAASARYVVENIEDASALCEKYDIVKAAIAEKSLEKCRIVCYTGNEMINTVEGYFKVLYDFNPDSVGGSIPSDDFYLMYD